MGWMFAQRLGADPLMMLEIRGQSIDALSDRLRQQRTLMTRGGATTHPNPPIDSRLLTGVPLTECVDRFWKMGAGFDEARRPAVLDHVPHALLRRLGAAPWRMASSHCRVCLPPSTTRSRTMRDSFRMILTRPLDSAEVLESPTLISKTP